MVLIVRWTFLDNCMIDQIKKKTGFKYLSFNDQTERKLSQADQKASRYLQNVVKQKRKKFSQFMFTGNCTQ